MLSLSKNGISTPIALLNISTAEMNNVLSSRSQTALPIGIEVDRVDGGVVVMPGDEQWCSLHAESGSSVGSLGEFDSRASRRLMQNEFGIGDEEAVVVLKVKIGVE